MRQKTNANFSTFKGKIELKKYPSEKYDKMSLAQCQQLYEPWKKTGLKKGKKSPESIRALEVGVAVLKQKQITVRRKACFLMKSPKLIMDLTQPLTEKGAVAERAMQILDG